MLTVIVGSFGGLEQKKLKSLLAYSSISHMGYTLIAFSAGTFEGIQSLFCYLFLYMIAGLCIWSIFLLLQLKYKYSKNIDATIQFLSVEISNPQSEKDLEHVVFLRTRLKTKPK